MPPGCSFVLRSLRLPMQIPISFPIEFDARVLLLTLGLALGTGVLFGLLPALQIVRPRLGVALRDGDVGAAGRRSPLQLRGMLVIAQIAATFVLLAGAGLFFRSLGNAQATDLGFRSDGLLVASLNLGYAGYDARTGPQLLARIETRLRGLPGVSAVSLATQLPFSVKLASVGAAPERYVPPHPGEGAPQISVNAVAPDYFATMQIGLAAGPGRRHRHCRRPRGQSAGRQPAVRRRPGRPGDSAAHRGAGDRAGPGGQPGAGAGGDPDGPQAGAQRRVSGWGGDQSGRSRRSASGSTGLRRWRSKPASRARARSSSRP